MDIQKLINDYTDWLKSEITFEKIGEYWKKHPTVLAFAPDHGCHKKLMFMGSHGSKKPYDMETIHFYSFIDSTEQCSVLPP